MYMIGVVGYSEGVFDEDTARDYIAKFFDVIGTNYATPGHSICVSSGWSNQGIPKLAYEEATRRGWITAGVACSKIFDYPRFPVNAEKVVGTEWGDESAEFIGDLDCLLRIGGGEQSRKEVRMFYEAYPYKPIFEMELERL